MVIYYGEVLVKRVKKDPKTKAVELISENKEYPPICVDGEDIDSFRIIGRVVGHFDRI